MRIIVTGSRNLYPREEAGTILRFHHLHYFPEEIRVVHGCCPSNGLRNVDWAFDEAAREIGLEVEQFHPEQYGPWPGCGPKRNSAMVDFGADLGIAYHNNLMGSKGTRDCVRKMIRKKIPVILYEEGTEPRGKILMIDKTGIWIEEKDRTETK